MCFSWRPSFVSASRVPDTPEIVHAGDPGDWSPRMICEIFQAAGAGGANDLFQEGRDPRNDISNIGSVWDHGHGCLVTNINRE